MSHGRDLNEILQVTFLMYTFSKLCYLIHVVTSSSTRLVESTNVGFVIYTTYHVGVTNFGDYRSLRFLPW